MADDEAAALLRDGTALAERLPDATPRVRLLLRLGARKSLTGAPEEARLHAEEALDLADRSRNQLLQFLARFSLQGALANRGRLRETLSRIAEAEAGSTPTLRVSATFSLGRAQLVGAQWRDAVQTLATFVHVERARLLGLVVDEAACQRELREAQRLFIEMGANARAEQVARELGT